MGDQASLSSYHRGIGIPINFQKSQALAPFEALNTVGSIGDKGYEAPCSDEPGT